MTRERPATTDLPTFGPTFDAMCAAAAVHWRTTLPTAPDDAPVVVVDVLMQDLRLALRTLTLANGLRRSQPARLVALIGPDRHWHDRIWDGYDRDRLVQLARAYGADDVIDVAALTELIAAGAPVVSLLGSDRPVAPPADEARQPLLDVITASTAVRILRVPRMRDATPDDDVPGIARSVADEDRLYRTLFATPAVLAFVTSHVDYGQWGLGVDAAAASGIPVIHAQATGGLKAYALFPDSEGVEKGFRRALTQQIATQFDTQVWPHREVLRASAERTAWRSKANLGRPSWWRGGGEISRLDLRSTEERRALRRYALERLGLDPRRPVVTVFNHAVSDAVQGNHEAFDDLATWFEQTALLASRNTAVSWLFLDHPSQVNYDRTEHFERLAAAYTDQQHLVFRPSLGISRNSLWSVTDLAVTVRGSVSAEFPAYGIPALQAGWSEWSHLGFSRRTDTEQDYLDALEESVRDLVAGVPLLTAEQVSRARLWLWFYRSGADVTTALVPHWENGQGVALHQLVTTAMNHVEDDADPAYVAVRRLWERRDPVLTRMDLALGGPELAASHAFPPAGSVAQADGLCTAHDTLAQESAQESDGPTRISSGHAPALRMVEGFVRGGSIVGRASAPEAVLVVDTGTSDGDREIEVQLALDNDSAVWWAQRAAVAHPDAARLTRRIGVGFADTPGVEVDLSPEALLHGRPIATSIAVVPVPPGSGRLVTIVLRSCRGRPYEHLPQSVIGLRVNVVTVTRGPSDR
ncbi:MAG: hypothetical protein ABI336_03415 [Humibacillus sp.]